MYHTVIWDFNGTLADDIDLGISSVNSMLSKRGLPVLTDREEYRRHFRFPIIDYYRSIGFDFKREPYEILAKEWFDLYLEGEPSLKPMTGAKETLERLRTAGLRQIVLSTSEESLLLSQIKRFGFEGYFDRVIGKGDIYAHGKAEIAQKILGRDFSGSVMIGDTDHDRTTADAIGADCILYSGGHGSVDSLVSTGAPVYDSLAGICECILSRLK